MYHGCRKLMTNHWIYFLIAETVACLIDENSIHGTCVSAVAGAEDTARKQKQPSHSRSSLGVGEVVGGCRERNVSGLDQCQAGKRNSGKGVE